MQYFVTFSLLNNERVSIGIYCQKMIFDKNCGLTKERFSDFVPPNFIKDCSKEFNKFKDLKRKQYKTKLN